MERQKLEQKVRDSFGKLYEKNPKILEQVVKGIGERYGDGAEDEITIYPPKVRFRDTKSYNIRSSLASFIDDDKETSVVRFIDIIINWPMQDFKHDSTMLKDPKMVKNLLLASGWGFVNEDDSMAKLEDLVVAD